MRQTYCASPARPRAKGLAAVLILLAFGGAASVGFAQTAKPPAAPPPAKPAAAASAPAPAPALKGRPEQGAVLANQTCVACHGPGGNPTVAEYPRLAGQIPEYLAKQLRAFQAPAGQRAHRASPIMQPIAVGLSEQQILDLAAYFTRQTAGVGKARDPARVEVGRKLYFGGNPSNDLPACVSCHRADGKGISPDFPRLAGQQPAYLEKQLRNWEANRGGRGKLMTMIVPHMKPEDIQATADFLAQMK